MARPIAKSAFIEAFAESGNMTKKDASAALDALSETIAGLLQNGQAVTIPDVVTLETRHQEARMGRNPATGVSMEIPAKTVPKAKFAKAFRDAVNQ